jgi:signal transduction histidine kinase
VAETLQANDRTVLVKDEAQQFFEMVPDPSGATREWLVLKFPVTGPGGARLVGGVAVDVTERRRGERRLSMQYAVTRAIAESRTVSEALSGLLPALARGTGWELAEIWMGDARTRTLARTHSWHDPSLDAADLERASRAIALAPGEGVAGRVWQEGVPVLASDVSREISSRRRDEAARAGLRVYHALPLRHGREILGVMAFFSSDATAPDAELRQLLEALGSQIGEFIERQRAEERIHQLQRQVQERQRLADIGALTAKILHDLGNPLAGLSLVAQTLLRRVDRESSVSSEALRPLAERLISTVGRLDRVLMDFRDFARGQHLDIQPVELARLLREVCDFWAFQAIESGVTLTLAPSPGCPVIQADPDKLHRVFDNLLKNAVEAMDGGPGAITISTAIPAPGKIRVSVEDSGRGVPEDIDIFALFETTKPGGSGLGLPICKQIVIAHGGGIGIAPRSPRGTIFHVDLPMEGPIGVSGSGRATRE